MQITAVLRAHWYLITQHIFDIIFTVLFVSPAGFAWFRLPASRSRALCVVFKTIWLFTLINELRVFAMLVLLLPSRINFNLDYPSTVVSQLSVK